jgi:hypothetical protein
MSTPLVEVLAAAYFLVIWKPRQKQTEILGQAERLFWATLLGVSVMVAGYVVFFRH